MRYLFILFYLFFQQVIAHEYEKKGVEIFHPVLKIPTKNSRVGAGYFIITNNSKKKILLEGIESDVAKKTEIHEVILNNNVYKMRPVKKGIAINPGEKLEFKSKSYHVMFFDMFTENEADEMLNAKLLFNDNFKIPIEFKVIIGTTEHNHN